MSPVTQPLETALYTREGEGCRTCISALWGQMDFTAPAGPPDALHPTLRSSGFRVVGGRGRQRPPSRSSVLAAAVRAGFVLT